MLAVIGAIAALATLGNSPATAKTAGIVPPKTPKRDCASASQWFRWTIGNINHCRAKEGVGRVHLPKNWHRLNTAKKTFVLINLERVNRGLAPIVGLSASLNSLAQSGAVKGVDPSFPSGGVSGGGAWAGGLSLVGAIDTWMYYDGPGGLDLNLACTTPSAPGCWGHRQNLLWSGYGGKLVAGVGYSTAPGYQSRTFEVVTGYPTSDLTFTWAHELRFFKHRPHREPLRGRAARRRRHHRHHHRRHHRHRSSTSSGTITITIS